MAEFLVPGDIAIVLDGPPQLDPGALLVFLGGHCHSLALALHDHTLWPLVAVDRVRDGERVHVAVRDPDGRLVDIAGRHSDVELQAAVEGGVNIAEVEVADVHALHSDLGWAEPRPGLARPWVPIALDPATSSGFGPMTTPHFSLTTTVEDVDVKLLWDGDPELVVDVRLRSGDAAWQRYGRVQFPKDSDGRHRFDFTVERFEALASTWLRRQFDLSRARVTAAA